MLAALVLIAQLTDGPLDFAHRVLFNAAGFESRKVSLSIKPSKQPESYTIKSQNGRIQIVGSDANGAMYGAMEFAERLHYQGAKAWQTKASGHPFLKDRGLNLFLTLPWDYKKNDTDYDPAALTDPNRWWFQNDDYWITLLDLMAKSRLNWLDIHGAWDISVTNAPNLYAYFVTSKTFPKVGVSEAIKAANLKRLNWVIQKAHLRGIRVSLMAYEANMRIPQNPNPGYEASEANIYVYTREVVEKMIRQCPKLDGIGFRIGESGRSESFFKCYGEAVENSGRDIPLITRSWITRKQRVLPLARASRDFTVEIKYNGEQWGAPYMAAGGRVANWYSYSFEDYLSDSSVPEMGKSGSGNPSSGTGTPSAIKMWPGNVASNGNHWPSQPYKIVWQVRANGTHRIFSHYNPNWVRRTIKEMPIGTSTGYTIEGLDAYYPKSPDYYLANLRNKCFSWIHQRDEMYWMTWGRLGYDPSTPDSVFDRRAAELTGSEALVEAWKSASELVSSAYMAYALGPDHRDHAPELEWGGDTNSFIAGQPFDSHAFVPINEEMANAWTGGVDGRLGSYEVGNYLETQAARSLSLAQSARSVPVPMGREILAAVTGMSRLATYYGQRLISAHSMAAVSAANGGERRNDSWPLNTSLDEAQKAHRELAGNPWYRPFTERLRMRTNAFAWSQETAKVSAEAERLRSLPLSKPDVVFVRSGAGGGGPDKMSLEQVPARDGFAFHATSQHAKQAWLLYKPLPSSTFFHRKPMVRMQNGFEASIPIRNYGYMVAAEFKSGETIWRCPDVLESTPYQIVPSTPGPTPQIYCSEEAMAYLDPKAIDPDRYGAILIGTRARNFFQRFDNATRRKLLDPVQRGMKMIILQADFAKDRLDFLPKRLNFENRAMNSFDPGKQLGLPVVDAAGILYQRFLPSEGWEVFGNGGLARMKLGKGEVWVTSARLMQLMHYPSAAKAFVKLLSLGGTQKPTILVDSCSEAGSFTSSCHPDLMNSHGIPFLTLGETIAETQGMNSFKVIPGPAAFDDLLGGRGKEIANAFLKKQVQEWSHRPNPKSLAEFQTVRAARKRSLMKSLGLDPMPPRTPLNARITGTIQREGYRIEKLVFESRPRFYVTAHLYIPDGPVQKRPVVVNVNGHWSHKKDEDRLQLPAAFQALQGYMAITIDSPGWSFEGNSLIERRAEGDHNDFFLIQGGTNTTGYYVWDCMRALDYLSTRPEADMSRIGITGASGGGLATLYTFAADDRYSAAVPVVYMSSQELAPDNGCLCNHIPGVCQIGDRSDVISVQAPKPVLIMGAEDDGEFPPDATRLTHKKMQEAWSLFPSAGSGPESGKPNSKSAVADIFVQIFPGGHDYNQPMRERMIGFFNKYLRGVGDGTPVSQPMIPTMDPEKRDVLVLDPPIAGERTMRDLSMEYLAQAPAEVSLEQAISLNGGRPRQTPLNLKESKLPNGLVSMVFESEPGLQTPGVYRRGGSGDLTLYVSDDGKTQSLTRHTGSNLRHGDLDLDILGTGELRELEMRYPIYLGRSVAFIGGWQIVRAIEAIGNREKRFAIVARGPISTQAAMWAALMEPKISGVDADECLASWADVFKPGVSPLAIQPRAHLFGSLANLRAKVRNSQWKTGN